MSQIKLECPRCNNLDKEKMSKQKEVEEVDIYQCEVSKFRWGIVI